MVCFYNIWHTETDSFLCDHGNGKLAGSEAAVICGMTLNRRSRPRERNGGEERWQTDGGTQRWETTLHMMTFCRACYRTFPKKLSDVRGQVELKATHSVPRCRGQTFRPVWFSWWTPLCRSEHHRFLHHWTLMWALISVVRGLCRYCRLECYLFTNEHHRHQMCAVDHIFPTLLTDVLPVDLNTDVTIITLSLFVTEGTLFQSHLDLLLFFWSWKKIRNKFSYMLPQSTTGALEWKHRHSSCFSHLIIQ